MKVSERGFGAWGIGGASYGRVPASEALRSLAQAEELGVNFIDTAAVYGRSEEVIGEFLHGRRDRWILATKYSGQPEGLTATVEAQLGRLRTTWIDFYQIHWAPGRKGHHLYEELQALKDAGKVRAVGVSLYTPQDIDYVLANTPVDGFQVAFGLLDPQPLLSRLQAVRRSGAAVVVRSCLKGGFLTGKYGPDAEFPDPDDQRNGWSREKIADLVAMVERFRFLEAETDGLTDAAVSYPLNFPEVSTVLLGTKTVDQARINYGDIGTTRFSAELRAEISRVQDSLGLLSPGRRQRIRSMLGAVKRLVLSWR
ncbi:MAG TPA: aldo/keto reductase [Longimicrobiales bacterium]|nr:aldo/keto reductase [Longimicrobiales bacterium]